jgi:hypothetical protein
MPTPTFGSSEQFDDILRVRILSRPEPSLPRLQILQASASATRSVRTGVSLALAAAPTRRFRLSNVWSERVDNLKASLAKTVPASAREDYQWFYSDPERVRAFEGQIVALRDRRVVGSGTAAEAVAKAASFGVTSPLLIRVLSAEERGASQMGL